MKLTFEGSCEEIYRILERVVSVPGRKDDVEPAGTRCNDRYLFWKDEMERANKGLPLRSQQPGSGTQKIAKQGKPLSDGNGDGQHPQLTKDDIWIEKFEHAPEFEKKYKRLQFTELTDGRVVLCAWSAKVYTTRERIMKIPFPIPKGYLDGLGVSNSYIYAIKYYREYLAEQEEEEKYKPMLKGAFSTRPADHDGGKIGAV